MTSKLVVAVDGPAGSGKSSVAARVAAELGLEHLDTGSMYRAFAFRCLRAGIDLSDEAAVAGQVAGTELVVRAARVTLDGTDVTDELRRPEVTAAASVVAQYAKVRSYLVQLQRRVVEAARPGAVVEGRDIGTVVLPDAPLKLYLTASSEARARRRAAQAGVTATQAREEVESRDERDSARKHSPLRPASDAIVLDTTDLDLDQVVRKVLDLVGERSE